MDKKDFSLLSSVAIKEFNFSFDELLQTIEEKLSQGGAKAVTEHICNWLSVVISNNYSETVLPKMETTCCETPYWLRHGKTQKTMQTSFGKLNLNLQRMKCKMMAKTGQGNDNENRPKITAKIFRHCVA